MTKASEVRVHPLTRERWEDFETVMGPKGGCGGCWCMLWRLSKGVFEARTGPGNRDAMREIVADNQVPGLLAYDSDLPVGWISVAPRSAFPRLGNSRVLKPVDAEDVWSVSCLLVAKSHRRRGIAGLLLASACDFVRARGGRIIEGYPIAPTKDPYPAVYAWTGFEANFLGAGFQEVARRSDTRPIMRKNLAP